MYLNGLFKTYFSEWWHFCIFCSPNNTHIDVNILYWIQYVHNLIWASYWLSPGFLWYCMCPYVLVYILLPCFSLPRRRFPPPIRDSEKLGGDREKCPSLNILLRKKWVIFLHSGESCHFIFVYIDTLFWWFQIMGNGLICTWGTLLWLAQFLYLAVS